MAPFGPSLSAHFRVSDRPTGELCVPATDGVRHMRHRAEWPSFEHLCPAKRSNTSTDGWRVPRRAPSTRACFEPDGSRRPAYWTIRAYTDPTEASRPGSVARPRAQPRPCTVPGASIWQSRASGDGRCELCRPRPHHGPPPRRHRPLHLAPGHVMTLHARLVHVSFRVVWTERSPHVQANICTTTACGHTSRLPVHRKR